MKKVIAGVALALGMSSVLQAAPTGTAHQFGFISIEGDPMPFSQFEGKSVLVVNTASRCGFTGQYAALQKLWQDYQDRGLVVLAVPSNDFGGQEPGSAAEIKEFCTVNYDVDFPMTEKQTVKGDHAHPFYKWVPRADRCRRRPEMEFPQISDRPARGAGGLVFDPYQAGFSEGHRRY